MELKIVLLRTDDPHCLYLESLLASRFNVVTTIEEPGREQRLRLWKVSKKAWFHRAYQDLRRVVMGTASLRKRFFSNPPYVENERRPRKIVVPYINDKRAELELESLDYDIVVVIATSILKEPIFQAIGTRPIINVHGGWLPDYRGNHCYFFAKYRRDYDKIGSTVHFVDANIDSGDIVLRARPDLDPRLVSAEELYCSGELNAFRGLFDALSRYENGESLNAYKQDASNSRFYRTKDRTVWRELSSVWRDFKDRRLFRKFKGETR